MRLLNAQSKQFEEFFDETPPYAILSHTWGSNELTFKQMEQSGYVSSRKIDGCCEQALKDGLAYVWVDTCCIDKSSSAELSEAINSMYAWYGASNVCYAYLSDIPPGIEKEKKNSALSKSRWFTRGWTLQELIAPHEVVFFDESWQCIGRKSRHEFGKHDRFVSLLSEITQISRSVLVGDLSRTSCIAEKMTWAARRTTTRVEDMAYSLLGLFRVNMPLLYGEGARAFVRLQEEILKASDDESIFAWGFRKKSTLMGHDPTSIYQLFASSPADFAHCGVLNPSIPAGVRPSHYILTNKGLLIEVNVWNLPIEGGVAFARLNCAQVRQRHTDHTRGKSVVLPLVSSRENDMLFFRHRGAKPVLVSSNLFPDNQAHIYVHRSIDHGSEEYRSGLSITQDCIQEVAYKFSRQIEEFYPPTWRRIMDAASIAESRKNLETQRQNILLSVVNGSYQLDYVVWFDYRYSLKPGINRLFPEKLICRASFLERGKSLAEAIMQNKGALEEMLDWQEVLDLDDSELRFSVDKGKNWHWVVHIEIVAKRRFG